MPTSCRLCTHYTGLSRTECRPIMLGVLTKHLGVFLCLCMPAGCVIFFKFKTLLNIINARIILRIYFIEMQNETFPIYWHFYKPITV